MAAASYRFYFAYLGNTEAYNSSTHARDDEEIFSVEIEQEEDEAAGATVSITYREGSYTALGRRAAISCRKLSQDTGALTGPVIPLIVGRITAAPIGLIGEVVELEIVAKADNWESRRATLLSVETAQPAYFDPLFYEPGAETDSASVLASRAAVLAWDRITGYPRLSFLTSGRDLEDDMGGTSLVVLPRVAKNSVRREVEQPLRSVTVEVAATWQQDASVRSTVKWKHGLFLEVVAHQAVQDAWPKPGVDIGGEWVVEESSLSFGKPRMIDLGEIAGGYDEAIYSGDVPVYRAKTASVVVKNNRKQARTEVLRITAAADIQELMAPATEVKTYALRQIIGTGDNIDPWQPKASYAVGDVVFYAGRIYECRSGHTASYDFAPLMWTLQGPEAGNIAESYFQTPRGQRSVAYATDLAKATLIKRARAVIYTVSVPLEDAIELAIDDMVAASLPGETVTGKVTRYQLSSGGWAEVEFACSIGRNVYHEPVYLSVAGTPPKLGPATYQATGSVTPSANEQIASLREAPDAYTLEATVEINAPAVPSTHELRRVVTLDAGTIRVARGVVVE